MIARLEQIVFGHRVAILAAMALFTVFTGYFATGLRLEAGFFKQIPVEHPYVKTFFEFEEELPGANLILVSLEANEGTIWNKEFLARLHALNEEVMFIPGVIQSRVHSIWTPDTQAIEAVPGGVNVEHVIPRHLTPAELTPEEIDRIRQRVIHGGWRGILVADDFSAAIIAAEIQEIDPASGEELDYLTLAPKLEERLREPFEDEFTTVRIIGFAKFVGDLAEGAGAVVIFFSVAFVLTALAVYAYVRSVMLTGLAVACSLVSVVWQFGLMALMGYGLDPLAILVPFLVYAIGVSHGVQQINLVATQVSKGRDGETAARTTFRRLLVPGAMALITDLVGFVTLYLIPIGVIQDLAVLAGLGVGLKIITNLVMLPILASYFPYSEHYVEKFTRARLKREAIMRRVGELATNERNAVVVLVGFVVLLGVAINETRDRHIGDLVPGQSELWPDARYNVDTRAIIADYSISTDALVLPVTAPEGACVDYRYIHVVDRLGWHLRNVPGVQSVNSIVAYGEWVAMLTNEGDLKWKTMPRSRTRLVQATMPIDPSTGLLNEECTILPVIAYLEDHKATTIKRVIAAVRDFKAANADEPAFDELQIHLAMGVIGIMAATNEVIGDAEVPMLLYVFAAIIVLVALVYRDWRAVIACCLPLVLATFLGYWFMTGLEIGLKVSTLPVLVLATGIGVDYAFYIYSRLQFYIREGMTLPEAYTGAMMETGVAVVFTAITLAIGVATWSFSSLKFQADMGMLLAFMFMVNMLATVTALPAFAVVLDRLIPRRREPEPEGRPTFNIPADA